MGLDQQEINKLPRFGKVKLPSLISDLIPEAKPLERYEGSYYFDVIIKGWNWRYIWSQIRHYWAKWNNKIMY